MQGHTLDVEAIEEGLADVLEQDGSTRHEIGNARIERIDVEIGVRPNIDEFTLARLSILAVRHGRDTPAVGSDELEAVGVGEGHGVVGNGTNLVVLFVE
jgi:hypothetical protein